MVYFYRNKRFMMRKFTTENYRYCLAALRGHSAQKAHISFSSKVYKPFSMIVGKAAIAASSADAADNWAFLPVALRSGISGLP